MDNGRCAEADSPAALLANDDSIFSGAVLTYSCWCNPRLCTSTCAHSVRRTSVMVGETGEATERLCMQTVFS